ncbi:MAG: ATP-binding cassette domain-containing protein [Oscillospiraceae bacterium]
MTLDGVDLQKAAPNKIISLSRTRPRGQARLCPHDGGREPPHGRLLHPRPEEDSREHGDGLQPLPRLRERRRQFAGTLSGGEQQMLATGRALMTGPKMVIMDEPSMGLSPILVKEIFAIIEELHKSGITILLVEQNAKMALAVSDRAYVLETGSISMEGEAAALSEDDRVRKAYLGA